MAQKHQAGGKHTSINMWFNWDTAHYYEVAREGYKPQANTYAFFPLYPMTVGLLSSVTAMPISITGLLLSNICLLLACFYIYKLALILWGKDEAMGRRCIKYLLLLPAGFVFSGFLSEPLYLLLAIAAFYYTYSKDWLYAGLAGFLLSLTRSVGVLIFIPIFIEYLAANEYSIKKALNLKLLYLGLIPLGTMVYAYFNYHLLGDALAFVKIQKTGWHNPLEVIFNGLNLTNINFIGVLVAVLMIALIITYIKKLPVGLSLFAFFMVLMPIISGPRYYPSLLRYLAVAFPVAMILAIMGRNKVRDEYLAVGLALLQGFLMVTWANCWLVYVV